MLKIIKRKQVNEYKKYWQEKKTVLVGGCFDLLHYGHLKFLQRAKKRGDFLIVILESDQFIKNKKRKPPVHHQNERAEILSAIKFVDLVILLPWLKIDRQYLQLVKEIIPKIIAVTEGDEQLDKKRHQAQAVGAKLAVVTSVIQKFSSSRIIAYENIFSDWSANEN